MQFIPEYSRFPPSQAFPSVCLSTTRSCFPEAHPIEFIAEDASPPCIINAATAPPLTYKTVSGAMPIFLDSGASDNCFVSRKDFVSYQPTFRQGQAALNKDGHFNILGEGMVIKEFMHGGQIVKLTFDNALHTPDLSANLVSVGKLDDAGYTVTFGGGRVSVLNVEGKGFTCTKGPNRMYQIGANATEIKRNATLLAAAVPLETLHRNCLSIPEFIFLY
jgi:hypothetical protein